MENTEVLRKKYAFVSKSLLVRDSSFPRLHIFSIIIKDVERAIILPLIENTWNYRRYKAHS